jgi:hypothetical protein
MVYVPSWTAQTPLTWTRRRSITFWARGTRSSHGGSEGLFHVALAENAAPRAGYRNARAGPGDGDENADNGIA